MELSRVTWVVDDAGVGTLTLNRPEALNALDLATVDELDRVLAAAEYDPAVRVLIITGAGRGFCAGADVKEWSSGAQDEGEGWVPRMHRVMSCLYWLPKPVIAAVNGVAVGAGCDLTLTADIRIAATTARFGEAYIRIGFSPDAGGSFLLPRIIGESRAAEMIFTGRIVDAAEAERSGLVSEVVDPEKLLVRAGELAATLAAGPTVAIGLAKRNIRKGYGLSFEEALRGEKQAGDICGQTSDHREGLAAVVEKRSPAFQGR